MSADPAVTVSDQALRIARRALKEISPGCSVFLDGGPLTVALASCFPADAAFTVVTNAMAIASTLRNHNSIELLLLGGWVDNDTATTVQTRHAAIAKLIFVDIAVLSAGGVSLRHGLSTPDLHDAELKRTMVRRAARTIVLLDSAAIGSDALAHFATLADVDTIIVGGASSRVASGAAAQLGARAVCV